MSAGDSVVLGCSGGFPASAAGSGNFAAVPSGGGDTGGSSWRGLTSIRSLYFLRSEAIEFPICLSDAALRLQMMISLLIAPFFFCVGATAAHAVRNLFPAGKIRSLVIRRAHKVSVCFKLLLNRSIIC